MVIAIVGYSYSGKYQVAKDITYHSDGAFHRLKFLTTRPSPVSHRHIGITEESRKNIKDQDIFHRVISECGHEYLTLKSQLKERGDVLFVVDDPRAFAGLEELGVPYAIVFVDCPRYVLLKHAEEENDVLRQVKCRMGVVGGRMSELKKSENYNLYLDMSKITPTMRSEVISTFVKRVKEWEQNRLWSETHMPFISEGESDVETAVLCKVSRG